MEVGDEVAGDPTDYSQTRNAKGNALVLMSMNVMPEKRGQHLPKQLITYVRLLAQSLHVQYIIGSFRPSEFGAEKQLRGCELSFEDYVRETVNRVDTEGSLGEPGMIVQLPKDGWLRSLSWLGMKPLKVDTVAMTVMVPMHQFDEYRKTYQPEKWWQKSPTEWECGEVGSWQISAEGATYREKNLWGMLTVQKGQK